MKIVLAGTDFSKSSLNACKYAALLAQQRKARLVVFNLYQTPVYHANTGLMSISLSDLKKDSDHRLQQVMKVLQQSFPELQIGSMSGAGAFKHELEQFVSKHRVAAVVMGLETKSRISKFIWGSHGVSVGGRIKAPVIIVPERYKQHRLQTTLLAVDNREKLSTGTLKGVEKWITEAKLKLQLLHVRTPDEVIRPSNDPGLKMGRSKREIYLQNAQSVEAGIKTFCKKKNIDMVAVISRKHSVFYNLFNESTTKRVAFASQVPVMALHE